MVNSRRKGSKNERKIATWFKEWTGYEFARTPSSGGLRWKGMDNVIGDIVCIDKDHSLVFPFSIECKVRDEINFQHLLLEFDSEIISFWNQCVRDANRGSKLPLLFMRYDGMTKGVNFVVLQYKTYLRIKKFISINIGMLHYKKGEYNLIIINSKDLLASDYTKVLTQLASRGT